MLDVKIKSKGHSMQFEIEQIKYEASLIKQHLISGWGKRECGRASRKKLQQYQISIDVKSGSAGEVKQSSAAC